jgi:hypothetical protein
MVAGRISASTGSVYSPYLAVAQHGLQRAFLTRLIPAAEGFMAGLANMGALELPVRAVLEENAEVGIVDADAVADSIQYGFHPELLLLDAAQFVVE